MGNVVSICKQTQVAGCLDFLMAESCCPGDDVLESIVCLMASPKKLS